MLLFCQQDNLLIAQLIGRSFPLAPNSRVINVRHRGSNGKFEAEAVAFLYPHLPCSAICLFWPPGIVRHSGYQVREVARLDQR